MDGMKFIQEILGPGFEVTLTYTEVQWPKPLKKHNPTHYSERPGAGSWRVHSNYKSIFLLAHPHQKSSRPSRPTWNSRIFYKKGHHKGPRKCLIGCSGDRIIIWCGHTLAMHVPKGQGKEAIRAIKDFMRVSD